MAINPPFISLVIPVKNIEKAYPGGYEQYKTDNPDSFKRPFLFDDDLVCDQVVMGPDLGERIEELEMLGLKGVAENGGVRYWRDFCVMDQMGGPTLNCPWISWNPHDGASFVDCDEVKLSWDGKVFQHALGSARINREIGWQIELYEQLLKNTEKLARQRYYYKLSNRRERVAPGDENKVKRVDLSPIQISCETLLGNVSPLSPQFELHFNTRIDISSGDDILKTFGQMNIADDKALIVNDGYLTDEGPFVLDEDVENELLQRTDYCLCKEMCKKLEAGEMQLIKGITLFREERFFAYDLLDKSSTLSILPLEPMKHQSVYRASTGYWQLDEAGEKEMADRLRKILRTAAAKGFTDLIFGDSGCMSLRFPAIHVARICKSVFEEDEFRNRFKRIVFCIPSSKKKEDVNLLGIGRSFRKVFEGDGKGKKEKKEKRW
ncbi:MAG: hypothetical protein RR303_03155 [Bacteroidales bacterium]